MSLLTIPDNEKSTWGILLAYALYCLKNCLAIFSQSGYLMNIKVASSGSRESLLETPSFLISSFTCRQQKNDSSPILPRHQAGPMAIRLGLEKGRISHPGRQACLVLVPKVRTNQPPVALENIPTRLKNSLWVFLH